MEEEGVAVPPWTSSTCSSEEVEGGERREPGTWCTLLRYVNVRGRKRWWRIRSMVQVHHLKLENRREWGVGGRS